jgi:deoxyuridine 5'-triphosphate nucleotidohydrolase (EC 3.6.1.23)
LNSKDVMGIATCHCPAYETAGAAGMDLRAFLPDGPITFQHGQLELISTGFHVALPQGTEMQIRPRSGLALKHGFILPNAPGTVDSDYRGVVMVGLYYLGHDRFTIAHGDRIAQAVIADIRQLRVIEVDELDTTARGSGGFGSTGIR